MRVFAVFCFAFLLAGCSDDPEDPSANSGAGAAGASTGVGGATGSSSGAGGKQGVQCGNERCTTVNEYCGFADDLCGETDDAPKCQPFPPCQPEEVACGCDGVSYESGCDAADTSRGIRNEGACVPPEGKFTCTYEYQPPIYCTIGAEYCQVQIVPSGDYPLECVALAPDCTPAPGDCICATACGAVNYCGVSDDGQEMTVYCD